MKLSDRMKDRESVSQNKLIKKMPVIIRIDGRAFHTFTKYLKPFDISIMDVMCMAAIETMREIAGCKASYVQSDEASFLLTDYETNETDCWFGYNTQKLTSVSSSIFTAHFNKFDHLFNNKLATFDSRAFNLQKEDVPNYFLWRARDCHRNSILSFAQQFFSQKQLQNKKLADLHEMLYGINKNWARDVSDIHKNGCFSIKDLTENKIVSLTKIPPNYEDIYNLLKDYI